MKLNLYALKDVCQECEERHAYLPSALEIDRSGWGTATYICKNGHVWTCGWGLEAAGAIEGAE